MYDNWRSEWMAMGERIRVTHRVHTEWQWPLSGAQYHIPSRWKNQPSLVEVGGCTHTPVTLSTITSKVLVYALAERADKLSLFLLYPYMYYVMRVFE